MLSDGRRGLQNPQIPRLWGRNTEHGPRPPPAYNLGYMVRELLDVSLKYKPITDKDSFINKTIDIYITRFFNINIADVSIDV